MCSLILTEAPVAKCVSNCLPVDRDVLVALVLRVETSAGDCALFFVEVCWLNGQFRFVESIHLVFQACIAEDCMCEGISHAEEAGSGEGRLTYSVSCPDGWEGRT